MKGLSGIEAHKSLLQDLEIDLQAHKQRVDIAAKIYQQKSLAWDSIKKQAPLLKNFLTLDSMAIWSQTDPEARSKLISDQKLWFAHELQKNNNISSAAHIDLKALNGKSDPESTKQIAALKTKIDQSKKADEKLRASLAPILNIENIHRNNPKALQDQIVILKANIRTFEDFIDAEKHLKESNTEMQLTYLKHDLIRLFPDLLNALRTTVKDPENFSALSMLAELQTEGNSPFSTVWKIVKDPNISISSGARHSLFGNLRKLVSLAKNAPALARELIGEELLEKLDANKLMSSDFVLELLHDSTIFRMLNNEKDVMPDVVSTLRNDIGSGLGIIFPLIKEPDDLKPETILKILTSLTQDPRNINLLVEIASILIDNVSKNPEKYTPILNGFGLDSRNSSTNFLQNLISVFKAVGPEISSVHEILKIVEPSVTLKRFAMDDKDIIKARNALEALLTPKLAVAVYNLLTPQNMGKIFSVLETIKPELTPILALALRSELPREGIATIIEHMSLALQKVDDKSINLIFKGLKDLKSLSTEDISHLLHTLPEAIKEADIPALLSDPKLTALLSAFTPEIADALGNIEALKKYDPKSIQQDLPNIIPGLILIGTHLMSGNVLRAVGKIDSDIVEFVVDVIKRSQSPESESLETLLSQVPDLNTQNIPLTEVMGLMTLRARGITPERISSLLSTLSDITKQIPLTELLETEEVQLMLRTSLDIIKDKANIILAQDSIPALLIDGLNTDLLEFTLPKASESILSMINAFGSLSEEQIKQILLSSQSGVKDLRPDTVALISSLVVATLRESKISELVRDPAIMHFATSPNVMSVIYRALPVRQNYKNKGELLELIQALIPASANLLSKVTSDSVVSQSIGPLIPDVLSIIRKEDYNQGDFFKKLHAALQDPNLQEGYKGVSELLSQNQDTLKSALVEILTQISNKNAPTAPNKKLTERSNEDESKPIPNDFITHALKHKLHTTIQSDKNIQNLADTMVKILTSKTMPADIGKIVGYLAEDSKLGKVKAAGYAAKTFGRESFGIITNLLGVSKAVQSAASTTSSIFTIPSFFK